VAFSLHCAVGLLKMRTLLKQKHYNTEQHWFKVSYDIQAQKHFLDLQMIKLIKKV